MRGGRNMGFWRYYLIGRLERPPSGGPAGGPCLLRCAGWLVARCHYLLRRVCRALDAYIVERRWDSRLKRYSRRLARYIVCVLASLLHTLTKVLDRLDERLGAG